MLPRMDVVSTVAQIVFVFAFLAFVWIVAGDGAATLNRAVNLDGSAVAWYGAVVATLSWALHAWNLWQDRAYLLIRVQPNMRVHAPGTSQHGKILTLVNVVNTGRRPTTISSVGFRPRKPAPGAKYALLLDAVTKCPVELSEGRPVSFDLNQADLDTADIEYFVVWDAAGREWTLPVEPSLWDVEGEEAVP